MSEMQYLIFPFTPSGGGRAAVRTAHSVIIPDAVRVFNPFPPAPAAPARRGAEGRGHAATASRIAAISSYVSVSRSTSAAVSCRTSSQLLWTMRRASS